MMHRRKKFLEFLKICPICESRFVTRIFEKIYCSPKCEKKAEEFNEKETIWFVKSEGRKREKKICKFCKEIFPTSRPLQKFCTIECQRAETYRRIKNKWIQSKKSKQLNFQRICKGCSKTFSTFYFHQIFCSPECNQNFHNSLRQKPKIYWQIFNRDNFTYQYCGKNPTQDGVKLVIDHIKSQIDGGKTEIDNSVTACEECNALKHSTPLRHEAEFKKRLKTQNWFKSPQKVFDFYI